MDVDQELVFFLNLHGEEFRNSSGYRTRFAAQVGVTTVGDVRQAGGDVIRTSGRSPSHATLTGLAPERASSLLTPTIPNPARQD